jgi:chemotaxis protein methyltransferase CheR
MTETEVRSSNQREFQFTDRDFNDIRRLVNEHTGISLSDAKRELVYGRLSRRLRALGLNRFSDYRQLLTDPEHPELGEFVNAVTTNLTAFFRERHHFDYLRETALPEVAEKHKHDKRIRIWSAGCSTGPEPYSIAMVVAEFFGKMQGWDIKILATDLDTQCVATGKRGIYTTEQVSPVDEAMRKRWLVDIGNKQFQVKQQLRDLVFFRQLNLMKDWPMKGLFDILFCRNVVIYFDKDTQRVIFRRYASLLEPESHLFIGHSESLYRVSEDFKLVGKTIYRRLP